MTSGTRLGPYEVTSKLGEGGMGEVWRATDSRLKRDVAIKVLPGAFVADRERLARFEREAQLLAQLNHPNIAQIYGVEVSGESRALVMELVEGSTLAERLAAGALPLAECLAVAQQMALALEEAHEKGIVHRDLKPQNVKVSPEGRVKVLDFGLAKAMDPLSGASANDFARSPTILNSPTITAAALGGTQLGVILGTAAYMAPEQAAGGVADRRADVWSFGVVLYEMLSGRRLFDGETVSHVLAGVLKDEADFSRLPAGTPARVRELVRRCLRKKPRERLQSIGDARVVLDEVLGGPLEEPAVAPSSPASPRRRPGWLVAAGLVAAAAAGAIAGAVLGGRRETAPTAPRTLSELSPPVGMRVVLPALSPDGSSLAMRATDLAGSQPQIWIRKLATGELRALPGTENGTRPFWSPDGRAIGYLDGADRWFKRVDLEGGRPVRLAKVGTGPSCGATWGATAILYCESGTGTLFEVAPTGGDPVEIARPGKDDYFAFPLWLEDGRHFLYVNAPEGKPAEARLRSVDGREDRLLTATEMHPIASGGRLYYGRGSTLLARRFDVGTGKLFDGEAEIVAEGVDDYAYGQYAVAAGLLVYAPLPEPQGSRVTFYDRSGRAVDGIDSDGYLDDLSLSADGRLAVLMKQGALSKEGGETIDVWRLDLERRIFDRVSFGERDDDPVFSPDGTRIAFAHAGDLYVKPANGSGEPVRLAAKLTDIVTNDWSADGSILYTDFVEGSEDLFTVPGGGGEPKRLTNTPFNERNATVSPDGRWLAYASDESGDMQVYLTAWPSLDGKWRVSSDRAAMPRWRRDGRELFFLAHDQRLMSVSVGAEGKAPVLSVAKPLFQVNRQATYLARTSRWAVTPDGDHFLVLEPQQGSDAALKPWMLVTPLAEAGRD